MTEMNADGPRSGTIDRRNLLGVAAWSTPVIAFAVATPASASSKVEYQAFSGSHIQLVTEDIERNGVIVATPTFATRRTGQPCRLLRHQLEQSHRDDHQLLGDLQAAVRGRLGRNRPRLEHE
ncbi:hypothetical protein [Pseudoclavibacter helvolus]|uniref:hypothetical protein n=1 Tax=Pseudoclavibacter helvolus TaxID=255205 RepID=UPI0037352B55